MKQVEVQQHGKFPLLGKYLPGSTIGAGGFSKVLQVYPMESAPRETQGLREKLVAKVQSMNVPGRTSEDLQREAGLALFLSKNPYIAELLDAGFDQGNHVMIMRKEKGSLRDILKMSTLSPEFLVYFLLPQIATALQIMHGNGIIHRDIKPDNILLRESTHALLSDFGLAIELANLEKPQTTILGTLGYIAPEQINGNTTYASDQYSLGIVAYEILTGVLPFRGNTQWEIIAKQLYEKPPRFADVLPASQPEEVWALEPVVMRALEKDPNKRFGSVFEFALAMKYAYEHAIPITLAKQGEKLYIQGNYQEALRYYEQAVAIDPTYITAHYQMYYVLHALKRKDEAHAALARILSLPSNDATDLLKKAWASHVHKRDKDAIDLCEQALQSGYAQTRQAYQLYALSLETVGRNEDAVSAYNQALLLDPAYGLNYFKNGNLLQKMGRQDDALMMYREGDRVSEYSLQTLEELYLYYRQYAANTIEQEKASAILRQIFFLQDEINQERRVDLIDTLEVPATPIIPARRIA